LKENKHKIEQKVYQSQWYKWIALVLFLLLILCLTLKCCKNTTSNNSFVAKPLPSLPGRIPPVDRGKIIPIPDDPFKREAVNDLVNIYLKDSIDISSFSTQAQNKYKDEIVEPTYFAKEYKRIQFRVDESKKDFLMAELKKDTAQIKFVTHEWILKQSFTRSNDPDFLEEDNNWFYEKIGLEEAWGYTKGDTSLRIAIIDDGFDLQHNELKNQFISPWNVFKYDENVYGIPNKIFHGTHVASSAIGEVNNGFGISGVAPNCKFIPIQISDENGIITISSLLDGIFYALKNKAQIINLSLGLSLGPIASQLTKRDQEEIIKNKFKDEEELWKEVFTIALDEDVLIVQAAGNDNVESAMDPMKRSLNTIIVGACNQNFEPSTFTNYGNNVIVYAPGTKIYSALPNNEMGYLDGTSMASPIVTGCVALIKSYKPQMKANEIIDLIKKHSTDNADKVIRINEILSDL
jgi:hypothetical protein